MSSFRLHFWRRNRQVLGMLSIYLFCLFMMSVNGFFIGNCPSRGLQQEQRRQTRQSQSRQHHPSNQLHHQDSEINTRGLGQIKSISNRLYALPTEQLTDLISSNFHLLANIDVSGVAENQDASALVTTTTSKPSAIFGNFIPGLTPSQAAYLDSFLAEVLIGVGALGLAYFALEDELPIGMAREELLYADESTLGPGVGNGLFARQNIPVGTVIGIYPGKRFKNKDIWINSKRSTEAAVLSMSYIWSCEDGTIIDPTNVDGILPVRLQVLSGLFPSISTYMSLINEPGVGQDVNVCFEENPERKGKGEVIVRTERDIYAGEELFTDYGPIYNRSNYYK